MKLFLSFVVSVVIGSHPILPIEVVRVSNAFKNAAIVPDIIPQPPTQILDNDPNLLFYEKVYFATSSVCLGSDIPHTHTALRPTIEYNANPDMEYTLIMIDPDLPAAATPAYRSTLHWLVVNIPGENLQRGRSKSVNVPGKNPLGGREICPYLPAVFYQGSGYRRYIFLLYAQNNTTDTTDPDLLYRLAVHRMRFSISDFVSHGAMGIGELVAGNYFVSSLDTNDRYCFP